MNSTVQNLKSQLRDIEKAIRDTQEKVAGRNREHLQRLEDQRQRLETDLEQIVAELEAAQQSRPAIEAEQRGLQGELRAAEDERARLVDEIQRLENNLRAAKPTNDDEFSMFGTGVTKAVREIERETRWRGQRPIGPLGRHVRLMDPEWKRVIEGNLNQSLNAFIVETKHDEDLLRSIFRRHNCRSAIMRSNRGPMPIQEPASHFTTVLRVLEFNDEMARKLLIINHRIEALVLVKTRREGQQLYESNGASYPQNVLAIISQDNYQIGST
ncbi:hypothetical protein DFJ74DRAFT_135420 [Hyaloraphidium curvatum]|nr:hypothetical protein DFJ74DRAFT_135420 [Hyaloraphidium curvatum]